MTTAVRTPTTFTPRQYARQVIGNVIAAPLFVLVAGLIPEPYRQFTMALLLGVAAIVYLGHGLGHLEWIFAAALAVCAIAGFSTYLAIGAGWLLHTVSDALHHRINRPMVPRIPMSSFGCAVFDPLIAIWFFLGAPALIAF